MYLQNKYTKCYYAIIEQAKSRTLLSNIMVEKHHIIPKSLGGSNEPSNLVKLTLREHFICHRLLPKMTIGDHRKKMMYAIWKMCHATATREAAFKLTARTYNSVKLLMRYSRTSEDFTLEWKQKIANARQGQPAWNKGIPRTTEERMKMSTAQLKANALKDPADYVYKPCSADRAAKIKESNTGKKWVHNPENPVDRKQLNADECDAYLLQGWKPGTGPRTPVTKIECPCCHKITDPGNYALWHGDKCGIGMSKEQRFMRTVAGLQIKRNSAL